MRPPLPDKFSSVTEVEHWLNQVPSFQQVGIIAADFSLDRMYEACRLLQHPERKVPCIHVAGTNGKGSTCAMLASIYRAAGYRVGLYTSPHLIRFNERIKVNGLELDGEQLVWASNQLLPVLRQLDLTYFEITTLLAWVHFDAQKCDLVILETGLGGRLDATNVVIPRLCVITSIGLDHKEILGDTIEQIASEKAGIIKHGIPVISGVQQESARNVIQQKANQERAELHDVSLNWNQPIMMDDIGELEPELEGAIQRLNARMALKAVSLMHNAFPVSTQQCAFGLRNIKALTGFGGRFEHLHPQRNWFFDGAHNPEALGHILRHLATFRQEPIIVLSLMKDKVSPEITSLFSDYSKIYYYCIQSGRAASFQSVQHSLPQLQPLPADHQALSSLLQAHRDTLMLFTGSFYFYPVVRKWMENLDITTN